MKTLWVRILCLMIFWGLVGLGMPACGPSDATDDDDDPTLDGDDTETSDLTDDDDDLTPTDGDETPQPDGDEMEEDGDLDIDDAEPEWDKEKIEIEEEEPDPCEGAELASCFTNAPAGTEGTRCQGLTLLECTVTTPQAPSCRSECRCQLAETCSGSCLDDALDGNAQCGPAPDGDLDDEVDDEEILDGDEDDVVDGDEEPTDGDEEEATDDDDDLDGDEDDVTDGDDDLLDGDLDEDGDLDLDEDADLWVCQADAFEVNNTSAQAADLDTGLTEDLTICNGEYDWYRFFAADGTDIHVRLEILGDQSDDLNVFIKDADETTLASGTTTGATEEVSLLAPVTGSYYIYVRGGPFAEARYNLTLDLTSTVDGDVELSDDELDEEGSETVELQESELEKEEYYVCPDDELEENDTRDEPTRVTSTTYPELHRCPSDDDWYDLPLVAGDTLSVEVLFDHEQGDLDVYLYNTLGMPVINSISETDNEIISDISIVTSGTWKIRVFGKTADVDNEYTMSVSVQPTTNCVDDAFENDSTGENDGPAQATTTLAQASSQDLQLCPYDPDWYEFHLEAGEMFYAKALFSHAEGNLDMRLWTAVNGVLLVESATTTDDELIVYESDRSQDVRLNVYGYNEYGIDYTLQVDWGELTICMEDSFEENDDFDEAYPLEMGNYELMLCQDDLSSYGDARDYWAFDLQQDEKLDLEATYSAPSIDMDFRLYLPDQSTVAVVPTTEEGRKIWTLFAPETGQYTLQTRKYNQTQDEPYELFINICPEDGYEENNGIGQAAYLTPGARDLALCLGDQDWFSVNVESGKTLTCTLQFLTSRGDLDLTLRNGNGEILAESATLTDNEQVSYTTDHADTYYIQVSAFEDAAQNTYRMILLVQ